MNVTVSQLNAYVKQALSYDAVLSDITVTGELSGVKLHSSGHIYFTLKDETALIRCAFFKPHSLKINFKPVDGMKVLARGRVTLYERDGQYQLNVFELTEDGKGDLYKKFEELKRKLEDEGLFSFEYKKAIPKTVKKIGVATSPTGAVIRDIINVSMRRCPGMQIVLAPVAVQGDDAPRSIIAGIDVLEKMPDVDVIIVGRGGGSFEDLWCFNDEKLIRRIFDAKKPIISAVGHETDFTLCDFVADLRAPTPSAAAELAVFDYYDYCAETEALMSRCNSAINGLTERAELKLKNYAVYFSNPEKILGKREEVLEKTFLRLNTAIKIKYSDFEHKNEKLCEKLETLNPMKVLERGYSVVRDFNGNTVTDSEKISKGDNLKIILKKGSIEAEVK